MLYDALIAPHAANDAVFLDCDDGTKVTYRDFVNRAAQIANVLSALDLQAGDRIVVQTAKTADGIALFAGALQAGVVYLPLNPAYTQSEVSYFVGDASPKLIICDPADQAALTGIADSARAQILTMDDTGAGTLAQQADAASIHFETVERGPNDLAALLYTSGTTGRSKGAMMSHWNLLSNAQTLRKIWRVTASDKLIHALPIFHTHGLFVAMNTSLLSGATVRFMARFETDAVIAALPNSTMMMGVPTFYTRLLDAPDFHAAACRNMRVFISGSAPLLAETHDAFTARTGHKILERYGMTETNMITSNPYDGERVAGTVGYALPQTEVRIMAGDTALPAGEIGMIEVRGPNVFHGYWQMPEKTKAELRPDGFFLTGDLGRMDPDGRLTIVGREKDLIISGGYNVYPKEVEDVLNACQGVVESAVFGVPHPDFGETTIAAIVTNDPAFDPKQIGDFVAQHLAKYKRPARYILMAELPRNTMGKVQKAALRAQFGNDMEN